MAWGHVRSLELEYAVDTCLCHIPTTERSIATERMMMEVRQHEMEMLINSVGLD